MKVVLFFSLFLLAFQCVSAECPPGYLSSGGDCSPCTPGSLASGQYCDGSNEKKNCAGQVQTMACLREPEVACAFSCIMTECPEGSKLENGACNKCDADELCPGGIHPGSHCPSDQDLVYGKCRCKNTNQYLVGSTCTDVGNGYYGDGAFRMPCPPNTYGTNGQCNELPDNSYPTTDRADFLCFSGHYLSGGKCILVEAGFHSDSSNGRTSCASTSYCCPHPGLSRADVISCSGTFSTGRSDSTGTSCICYEGYFWNGTACARRNETYSYTSTSATDCASRNQIPNEGHTQCVGCERNEYFNGTLKACMKCPFGYYCDGVSRSSCSVLTGGQYCKNGIVENCDGAVAPDRMGCQPCPSGYACSGGVLTRCFIENGDFSNTGETTCTSCGSKIAVFNPITGNYSCEPCDPGYTAQENECVKTCNGETYYDGSNPNNQCVSCSSLTGAYYCREQDGRYVRSTCSGGVVDERRLFCGVCPEGYSCPNGGKQQCEGSQFSVTGDSQCHTCPLGSTPDDNHTHCELRDGYYLVSPVPIDNITSEDVDIRVCPGTTSYCVGGNIFECMPGTVPNTQKTSCVSCDVDHYSSNGTCEECDENQYTAGQKGYSRCLTCQGNVEGITGSRTCVTCSKAEVFVSEDGCVDCTEILDGSVIFNDSANYHAYCLMNNNFNELAWCYEGYITTDGELYTCNLCSQLSGREYCLLSYMTRHYSRDTCPADYGVISAERTDCKKHHYSESTAIVDPHYVIDNVASRCSDLRGSYYCSRQLLNDGLIYFKREICEQSKYVQDDRLDCLACPDGSYCDGVTYYPCSGISDPHSYCSESQLELCPIGFKQSSTRTSCTKCTEKYNTYCDGTVSEGECPDGSYITEGKCVKCDEESGVYCPHVRTSIERMLGEGFVYTATEVTSCGAGYFLESHEDTYVFSGESIPFINSSCTLCPSGFYCLSGSTEPTQCPSGTTTMGGAKSVDECVNTPAKTGVIVGTSVGVGIVCVIAAGIALNFIIRRPKTQKQSEAAASELMEAMVG